MANNNAKIEQRIHNMKNVYLKIDQLVDSLPDEIPTEIREKIKHTITGDAELKKLMDGIDSYRPPRIFLVGRTGVGKSSLINAMCGSYVAPVSDTRSCTAEVKPYQIKDGDRVLMELLDTRGIAESESLNSKVSAEDMIAEQINEFSPDVAILMLNCVHRDDVDEDVLFLKELAKQYKELNKVDLPIVAVVNKCDEMAPTRYKTPSEYPESKLEKIQEVVRNYKSIIVQNGLKIDDIIAVSSLIDWQTPDGMEVPVEDIDNLPKKDRDNLQMAFDGRYQIEELLDDLEEAIPDVRAQMGLRMAMRLEDVLHRLAKHLCKIFSGFAATVALTPIPITDLYILILLQAVLVTLIAALAGRELSLESGEEFVFGMGGVAGAGYMFRLGAEQAAKLVNAIYPGAGSAVSSAIAATGTATIGNAAIAHYIDEKDMAFAKGAFAKAKDKIAKRIAEQLNH